MEDKRSNARIISKKEGNWLNGTKATDSIPQGLTVPGFSDEAVLRNLDKSSVCEEMGKNQRQEDKNANN
jgi:hypothetical protein